MRINSDFTNLNTLSDNHSHQVTEHVFEHQSKAPASGGSSAGTEAFDSGVIYEPSYKTASEPATPEVNFITQSLSSVKNLLKQIWGPTKEELASSEKTMELNADKVNPYPSAEKKKRFLPYYEEFRKRIVRVAANLFHFQSGSSSLPNQQRKQQPKEQIVVENVKLELNSDAPYSEHLLDSYDRTGAYVPLASSAISRSNSSFKSTQPGNQNDKN